MSANETPHDRARKMHASTALGHVQWWAQAVQSADDAGQPVPVACAEPVELRRLAASLAALIGECARLADHVPELERLRIDVRALRAAAKAARS